MWHEIKLHRLMWCQRQGRFSLLTRKHKWAVFLESCTRPKIPQIFKWRYLQRIHFTFSAHIWFLGYSSENWVIVQEFSVQKRMIVEGKQEEEWGNLRRKKERKNMGYNLKGYLWGNKTDLSQVKKAIFPPFRVTITSTHNLHIITQNCRLLSFGL